MREILFRGKRDADGEWVYGAFYPDALEVLLGLECLSGYIKPYVTDRDRRRQQEVDRETVGQYTGLKDKNGAKIFEGDLLEFLNDDGDKSLYAVQWDDETAGWTVVERDIGVADMMDCWSSERWTVVGNVWDGVKEATQ